MVLPLIPIAAGIGAGMLGQGILGFLSADKKPSISTTTSTSTQSSNVYHAPYEQYQPTTLYAPQQSVVYPSYQVSIESPGSNQESVVKQSAKQDTKQYPTYDQPVNYPTQASTPTTTGQVGAGISSETIMVVALIAAGGLVAYGVLK